MNEDVVYVTNDSISTDYSNEFVNEDAIVWDWNSIPYIDIVPTVGSYNGYRAITTTFTERTVPVESWKAYAYRVADAGDVKISNITYPAYTSNTFVVRGGTSSAPADLSEGIYKIYVNLTGINDVTGNTDSIYKAVPETYNASTKVSFSSTPTAASNLNYNFTYKNAAQNKYIKSGKLILTPLKLDISSSMLGDLSDAASFATADPYYKFEYDLPFTTNLNKNAMVRSIPLKSLPNGIYTVAYEVEDILGNKISDNTNSTGVYMGNLSWNYTNIGTITCNTPVVESITKTTDGVTTWVNDIVKFTWSVTNPTELDKVTFSMIHNSDIIQGKDVIAETGDVFVNLRQSVDTTSTESISNVWQPTKNSNTYNFTHTIAPEKIPDGDYKIITSHAIEMLDYVSERVVNSEKTMTYTYNAPKCTISSINPVMKLDRAKNRWKPVFDVSVNFSKNELGSCPVAPKVDVTDIKLNVLNASNSYIIKDKIVPKQSKYEYDFDDVNMKYSDKNKTLKFSYKCRDVIDTIWKRSEKNPTQYIISRNDTGFGSFISMLPKTPESIYNYNNYTSDNKTLSGVEVANESAVDIYRVYANAARTLFSSVASPCYFYKTTGSTNTNLYTYFTTKVYTDENNSNKKFGRYVWSDTQTEQTLELLPYVEDYVLNTLKPVCSNEYDKSVDSSSIIMDIPDQSIDVPDVTGGKFE